MKKIYVVHTTKVDYKNELYIPLKDSKIYKENTVILPHDSSDKLYNSKYIINSLDLVIVESTSSTINMGIELGWADYNNVPIITVIKKGTIIPNGIKLISTKIIEYETKEDMISKLEDII